MSEEIKEIKIDPEEEKKEKIKKTIGWVVTILVCLTIAKLFTTFVVRSVEIEGVSMSTTLSDGDKALTDALFYKIGNINRFDIVIVKKKADKYAGVELVKRVIGLPGETIEYKSGVLYINGEEVEETYISDEVKEQTEDFKKVLGDDEYFVMGDNRDNSDDSRRFGAISKKEIKGRGLLRFMVCTQKDGIQCTKRKFVWPSSVK